jgi:flagellar L-ring protein precursor FlgH
METTMFRSIRPFSSAGLVVVACVLGACGTTPQDPAAWQAQYPQVQPPAAQQNGSIWQPGRDASLFSNATAHNVGDLLTIRLEERTSASKSATTSTSKSTSTRIPGPTIGGRPVTVNGVPILETDLGSEHSFDGEGDSAQSNQLDGSVTVTVVGRVGNGNLLVRGQKWLALNQGKEFIRVEGVVRAIDVEPDNSIPSWKVADARIAYGGRGALEDANSMGWLARFFQSPVMPF